MFTRFCITAKTFMYGGTCLHTRIRQRRTVISPLGSNTFICLDSCLADSWWPGIVILNLLWIVVQSGDLKYSFSETEKYNVGEQWDVNGGCRDGEEHRWRLPGAFGIKDSKEICEGSWCETIAEGSPDTRGPCKPYSQCVDPKCY